MTELGVYDGWRSAAFRRAEAIVFLLVVSTGSAVVSTFFVPQPWRSVEIALAAVFDVLVLLQSRPRTTYQ
jgi:hypothetical protein